MIVVAAIVAVVLYELYEWNKPKPIIKASMVLNLQIGACKERIMPCSHDCTITLNDGKQRTGSLPGFNLYVLKQSIGDEIRSVNKIDDHLDVYRELPLERLRTPEEILSDFFFLTPFIKIEPCLGFLIQDKVQFFHFKH